MDQPLSRPVEAFCQSCPDASEIEAVLQPLGLTLTFTLAETTYQNMSPLPTQYYFEGRAGTQVIYLAGCDLSTLENLLPPHASRWWVYPGHDPSIAFEVRQALASRWFFTWIPVHEKTTGRKKGHAA